MLVYIFVVDVKFLLIRNFTVGGLFSEGIMNLVAKCFITRFCHMITLLFISTKSMSSFFPEDIINLTALCFVIWFSILLFYFVPKIFLCCFWERTVRLEPSLPTSIYFNLSHWSRSYTRHLTFKSIDDILSIYNPIFACVP